MFKRIHAYSIIFSLLFLGLFLVNAYQLHSPVLGSALLLFYVGFYGWEMGTVVAKKEHGLLRWWIGAWLLLSIIMILGAAAYYSFYILPEYIHVLILLTPPVLMWLVRRTPFSLFPTMHNLWSERKHRIPQVVWLAVSIALLLLFSALRLLHSSTILDSVRSPWERIDSSIFLLLGGGTIFVFGLLYRGRERALTIPLVILLSFVFLSVTVTVFPIGYGFDSFIHKATESHLAQFGTITPKPFYYIGQYALVLFVHHGFSLPISFIDSYLVPVLFALFVPSAWYAAAVHITQKKRLATATLMGLFLIPLTSFIVTTPQALANLWTLLIVLASIPFLLNDERPGRIALAIPALAALSIHPISGIPVVLYLALLFTDPAKSGRSFPVLSKVLYWLTFSLTSIVLPLSFVANAFIGGQPLGINWSALNPYTLFGSLHLNLFFENRFAPVLDFVYLYGFNAFLLFLGVSVFAWAMYRKDLSGRLRSILLMIVALSINYLLLKTVIDFSFLIDYERQNYAERLIPLITFFLVPFFILGMSHLLVNLRSRPIALRATAFIILVALSVSAFYLTYPRRDSYETNHGFNVSESDISMVHLIEEWADTEPYLVLANQSVSAAAIEQIGFRYYGDLFFYPIPTGEALYQFFLQMNESPSREIAEAAKGIVPMHGDVNTVFFVVNNYWWLAPRIIETAKTNADDWKSVGGGVVHVFRYDF